MILIGIEHESGARVTRDSDAQLETAARRDRGQTPRQQLPRD